MRMESDELLALARRRAHEAINSAVKLTEGEYRTLRSIFDEDEAMVLRLANHICSDACEALGDEHAQRGHN